jgi:hypothetical protein
LLSALPIFTRALIAFVRANNPTYSFISLLCIQQYYCLSPFMFSAVAPKTSSWVCSTTFCTKLRNATLLFILYPTKRSKYFTSLRKLRSVLILRLLVICRNTASCSSKNSIKIPFFCGTAGCLSYQQHFAKTEKNAANLECIPYFSRSCFTPFS